MRSVFSFLKPYRRHLVIGPAFKLAEAVLELAMPLLIAYMIDTGIESQDRTLIWRLGLLALLMAATGLGCATVCQYTASLASQGVGTDLRHALFSKINHLSLRQLDHFGTSSLVNRLTGDVNLLQQAVAMLIRLVVRAPFLSIGGLIMAMMIDLRLSLILLLILPVFILIVYLIMSRTIPMYRKIQQVVDRLMRHILENLTGVRVIRAFARRSAEKKRFDLENDQVAALQIRVSRISNLLNPVTALILNAATIALLWVGAIRIEDGALTRGQIIALINYVGQILTALLVVANLVILYTRAYASAGRVAEILDLPNEGDSRLPEASLIEEDQQPAGEELPPVDPDYWLRFDRVQFQYPDTAAPIFDRLDFTVGRGRSLGIIGPTGSGKSTLAWLLLRLWPLTSGQIWFDGQPLAASDLTPSDLNIAIVPQKSVLFSGTIAENLRLGRADATDDELWQALRVAQAETFVRRLDDGLHSQVQRGGVNFSGGQRQRLAVARALVSRPRLLIMDDSTSALDYATEAALRRALAGSGSFARMRLIIISQRVASIRQTDEIVILDDGRLAGQGTHDDLLRENRLYQEIWQSQQSNGEVVG
ncbi:MAG: ABC transporter ATP-binding protein [Eubacteriales bacterium]|nr:ABC transporter ATP-binding protein [Eubacteriales bacterium]